MTSVFAWLDHDETERRKMLVVVNLFREKGTLDELGIGTIRDGFANHFFPGTSTIQTRTRYFLFLPWIYQRIERERVPSAQAGARARRYQAELAHALQAGGEKEAAGVIGMQAGENLQRPPSVIYWAGLRHWGIRTFPGSLDQYHSALDGIYRTGRTALRSDDGESELIDASARTWHGGIPAPPENLYESTTFRLRREDADYLQERIRTSAPDTFLARLVEAGRTVRGVDHPWELPFLSDFPRALQEDVEHARLFSLAMHGAALLYNLMMAQKSVETGITENTGPIERYRSDAAEWATNVAQDHELTRWSRPAFWAAAYRVNPNIPLGARRFADRWMETVIEDAHSVFDDRGLRTMIVSRERALKGSLARLSNRRALERWSGASGLNPLNYRWREAQTVATDIRGGLVSDA